MVTRMTGSKSKTKLLCPSLQAVRKQPAEAVNSSLLEIIFTYLRAFSIY